MESGKILDPAIEGSSVFNINFLPHYGRLNVNRGGCGWSPKSAERDSSWIRVDLGDTMSVTGIATQGVCNSDHNFWVTSYSVSYSVDFGDWEFLKESGSTKVGLLTLFLFTTFKFTHIGNLFFQKIFTGNTDSTTILTHGFKNPIIARYIKITPQSYTNAPVLRMELYTGCY